VRSPTELSYESHSPEHVVDTIVRRIQESDWPIIGTRRTVVSAYCSTGSLGSLLRVVVQPLHVSISVSTTTIAPFSSSISIVKWEEHAEHNQAYSGDRDLLLGIDNRFRPSKRGAELIK
jgi:hypothetical protein